MQKSFSILFNRHFEWMALVAGLLLMALMNPYVDQGNSWCLFEQVGIGYCPGEGLGHSIAFIFRGDFSNALQANVMGFFTIPVILGRIGTIWKQNYKKKLMFNNYNKA